MCSALLQSFTENRNRVRLDSITVKESFSVKETFSRKDGRAGCRTAVTDRATNGNRQGFRYGFSSLTGLF